MNQTALYSVKASKEMLSMGSSQSRLGTQTENKTNAALPLSQRIQVHALIWNKSELLWVQYSWQLKNIIFDTLE